MATPATSKQHSVLYRFTGRKFWQPEIPPAPDIKEASILIELMFAWANNKDEAEKKIISSNIGNGIRRWFPDYKDEELHRAWFGKSKKSKHYENSKKIETEQQEIPFDKKQEEQEEQKKEYEEKKEPEADDETPQQAAIDVNGHAQHEDPTVSIIIKMIKAGVKNIFLTGPAGCGKTWACVEASKICGLPITILSCSAGTSASDFTGRRVPNVEPSPVSAAIGVPGIIVLDEITMLDPAIAAVANAMLANNIVQTTHGAITRQAVIIATANTKGDGANRQYIGNNQLDASTLDRFSGCFVEVNYNTNYEKKNYPREVVAYVHYIREIIKKNNLERIASTRAIITGTAFLNAGFADWKERLVSHWTESEKGLI